MSPREIARTAVHAWNLLAEEATSEMYRAQARRARDPRTAAALRQIQAHEATHACEARARVEAPDAIRRPAETAARLTGGLVGTLTSLGGDRAALAFDYALERVKELGYRAGLKLLPPDGAGSERRVLRRAMDEEREHQALLRERLGV